LPDEIACCCAAKSSQLQKPYLGKKTMSLRSQNPQYTENLLVSPHEKNESSTSEGYSISPVKVAQSRRRSRRFDTRKPISNARDQEHHVTFNVLMGNNKGILKRRLPRSLERGGAPFGERGLEKKSMHICLSLDTVSA